MINIDFNARMEEASKKFATKNRVHNPFDLGDKKIKNKKNFNYLNNVLLTGCFRDGRSQNYLIFHPIIKNFVVFSSYF